MVGDRIGSCNVSAGKHHPEAKNTVKTVFGFSKMAIFEHKTCKVDVRAVGTLHKSVR